MRVRIVKEFNLTGSICSRNTCTNETTIKVKCRALLE